MKMIRHKAICEAFCFLTEIPRSQCFKNIFGPLVVSEKRSTVLGANSDTEHLVRGSINLFRKANVFSFEFLHDSRSAAHRGCRFWPAQWPALRTNGRHSGRPYEPMAGTVAGPTNQWPARWPALRFKPFQEVSALSLGPDPR